MFTHVDVFMHVTWNTEGLVNLDTYGRYTRLAQQQMVVSGRHRLQAYSSFYFGLNLHGLPVI